MKLPPPTDPQTCHNAIPTVYLVDACRLVQVPACNRDWEAARVKHDFHMYNAAQATQLPCVVFDGVTQEKYATNATDAADATAKTQL